ncbi:MAG: S26 family signal peptidase [Hyphomicrobium sp.]|nr:S26 family signal peptidase [Hyphomicrobium sp.]
MALVFLGAGSLGLPPVVIWNASHSVPVGLYQIADQPVVRGQLALIKLPSDIAVFANARGYLPVSAYLLKPIVGISGDRVCRIATVVTINARMITIASVADSAGHRLPRWQGCRVLRDGQIFVLATRAGSFDGRYFGVLTVDSIVGRARAIWTPKDR